MLKDNLHFETNFEQYITRKLAELEDSGWIISNNDNGFDPETALCPSDFIEYFKKTEPDKAAKMKENLNDIWEKVLIDNLVHSLEVNGTVLTLRDGFQIAGYQKITCSGRFPDDPRLPEMKDFYDNNTLRIMRQVHYQTAGGKSVDLVFFVNGIPVATAEVKTELTQTVHDAITEYQEERKPVEPGTNRKNYLLMYKRGAVVHFAISEDEIWMCTDLSSKKPRFLPFNKGTVDGHAGNPTMNPGDDDYPTGYFWNEICRKDNWLKIFHNFVFEEVYKKEDLTGRIRETRTQIFPRFHQWDVVTKCIEDVKKYGVGQKYLIEHSAGSGKTETITWISHELTRLMNADGSRTFSSVIVVTDRIGLDTNIKKTIGQLKKTVGLIEMIGGDADHKFSSAKSKQLSKALADKREIIVVTLQTFPFALDAIASEPSLAGSNFAVLIDEAHSSQEGSFSGKMKAALKYASDKSKLPKRDDDEITDEDAIDAFFLQLQDSKAMPDNVSFFAFTATPKAETKTIFGRPGDRTDEKTGRPIPESFHLYPMRQAIEEGYILDVLKGYMPYKTAYKLKEDVVPENVVDERAAIKTIAKWESHHPTNVMSKAEFIVEHFVKNVAMLLDGQAKAMVVTSSRAAVVRYKYAIDAYIKAHPEYDRNNIDQRLQFTVPGSPLVAFSGKVSGSKAIMPEDSDKTFLDEFEYLKDNPFAEIKRDCDYTEQGMNGLTSYENTETVFDKAESRMLIVANKFQTGFNQPKLCAMYIDKRINNDIEIVQTYSRLNRTAPGKDTVYIVDFINDPDTVLNAFKKYDRGAEMESAQRLEIIYEIKNALDSTGLYSQSDFEDYKLAKYRSMTDISETRKDAFRAKIYNLVALPATRWNEAFLAQQNAYSVWLGVREDAKRRGNADAEKNADAELRNIADELDKLQDFKKKLKKYCSAYDYITQVIDLGEPDLEVFSSFAKLLFHRLKGTSVDEIDISSLVLSDYKLRVVDMPSGLEEDNAALKPMTVGGTGRSSKKENLRAIVAKINEIWGSEISTITGARTINAIADYVAADDVSRIQIRNTTNSREAIIADGRMENIIKMAALALKTNDFEFLADKIISDPQAWKPLAEMIYDLVDRNKRIDMPDLMGYVNAEKKN